MWVIWCFSKKKKKTNKNLCTRHYAWADTLSWWICQSPVAHSYGLLNHLNSFCGGMFKVNTKFDADSLFYILNVMTTQNTCSLNGIYCPHWLVQWSHHHSCMDIPVHTWTLSLAARLHWCCTNHSCYINNCWTFFWQTSLKKGQERFQNLKDTRRECTIVLKPLASRF